MNHVVSLRLIELEENNYHLVLASQFPGGREYTWVIDTGASRSVFDLTLTECYTSLPEGEEMNVQSAGIGAPALEASLGILSPFSAGPLTFPPMKIALLDLTHINDLYFHAVGEKICGLIGSDFLMEHRAIIDFGKLEMVLMRPHKTRKPRS